MKRAFIEYKVLVAVDGIFVSHNCGIVDTSIKDLFSIGEDGALHPDLVAAAMTSIQTMAAKYNGVHNDESKETGSQKDGGEEAGKEGCNQGSTEKSFNVEKDRYEEKEVKAGA